MHAGARALFSVACLRSRVCRRLGRYPPREELVRRYAPGRSFADVGCMWNIHGAIALLAEESGATSVSGVDVMAPTDRFEAERRRRGSRVRFVRGDLHDAALLEEVGAHDVVWCTGVLYHAPSPLETLTRLRSITRERLILGSATMPEIPGLPQACIFYPGLDGEGRRAYRRGGTGGRVGVSAPFDPRRGYANWWWGITPSALRGMLVASGFAVEEVLPRGLETMVVARPTA